MGIFFSLLAVLFIGLKLASVGVVATWSWWLVLLPLYGGFALWLALFFIALIFTFITHAFK